jgi:hypothetical protein
MRRQSTLIYVNRVLGNVFGNGTELHRFGVTQGHLCVMHLVPDHGRNIADHVSKKRSYNDKRNRRGEIKRPNRHGEVDHMRSGDNVVEELTNSSCNQ